MIDVAFNQHEKSILDCLRKLIKPDGCIAISDTALIQKLAMDERDYFRAKMRLRDGKQIDVHVDGSGRQLIEMLAPEGKFEASKRQIFDVYPLAIRKKIKAIKEEYRAKILNQPSTTAGPKVRPAVANAAMRPPAGHPGAKPQQPMRDYSKAQETGMNRLGVHRDPRERLPLRPPMKPLAGQSR